MLTLRKLKEIVEIPEADEKVPTYKHLRDGQIPMVCSKKIEGGNDAEILVYMNGYVVYRVDNRVTVFPINLENDYCYPSVSDMPLGMRGISDSYFEDEVWYMLLVLIGEDRLQHNLFCRDEGHCISFEALPADFVSMKPEEGLIEDQVVFKLEAEELMRELKPKQRKAIKMRIWNEQPRRVIAKELGGESKVAVTHLINHALDQMRKSAAADSDTKK